MTLTRPLACVLMMLLVVASARAQPPLAPQRSAQTGYLGILAEELPFARLDALELPYGVLVGRVFSNSAAARAGLRAGDIILELNDQPVFSVPRLRWLVEGAAAGDSATIDYARDGQSSSTRVVLGPPADAPGVDPRSAGYLGISPQALTAGLREAFAVPDGMGVLIAEVYPDTPAARAGLAAGDVIVQMDRRAIQDIADIYRVLDYFEPGERLEIGYIREGERLSSTVTLGDRSQPPPSSRGPQPSGPARRPLFDPAWWESVEEFAQRWKEYFEQLQIPEPPGAL